jgi:hypothetical protein
MLAVYFYKNKSMRISSKKLCIKENAISDKAKTWEHKHMLA